MLPQLPTPCFLISCFLSILISPCFLISHPLFSLSITPMHPPFMASFPLDSPSCFLMTPSLHPALSMFPHVLLSLPLDSTLCFFTPPIILLLLTPLCLLIYSHCSPLTIPMCLHFPSSLPTKPLPMFHYHLSSLALPHASLSATSSAHTVLFSSFPAISPSRCLSCLISCHLSHLTPAGFLISHCPSTPNAPCLSSPAIFPMIPPHAASSITNSPLYSFPCASSLPTSPHAATSPPTFPHASSAPLYSFPCASSPPSCPNASSSAAISPALLPLISQHHSPLTLPVLPHLPNCSSQDNTSMLLQLPPLLPLGLSTRLPYKPLSFPTQFPTSGVSDSLHHCPLDLPHLPPTPMFPPDHLST
ncbi:protein Wnt-11 [Platysternon megacephalum]|uniref:Protein Wnt-11 n=1 Tax=Platysternon megacephalum TaxID=55544 RepID=A0A4D9E9F7_9SAUR|nr:protein Wnt-11 [Platysternon megacephalum]